jgi:hypothetical protein
MNKRAKWRGMNDNGPLYIGGDLHEKESQLVVLETEGSIVLEERIPTRVSTSSSPRFRERSAWR